MKRLPKRLDQYSGIPTGVPERPPENQELSVSVNLNEFKGQQVDNFNIAASSLGEEKNFSERSNSLADVRKVDQTSSSVVTYHCANTVTEQETYQRDSTASSFNKTFVTPLSPVTSFPHPRHVRSQNDMAFYMPEGLANKHQENSVHSDSGYCSESSNATSRSLSVDCGIEQSFSSLDISSPDSGKDVSSYISSLPATPDPGCKKDFVIIHTEEDNEAVHDYMDHVKEICGDDPDILPNVVVDSFMCIKAGKTISHSLTELHDDYHYIMLFVTDNFNKDKYHGFLADALILHGLMKCGGREYKVLPVWCTPKDRRTNICLNAIKGFDYINGFKKDGKPYPFYADFVRKTVRDARRVFP